MALDPSAADTQQAPAADELRAWLQLLETPGLGRQGVRRLLAAFGDPRAVWSEPRTGQRWDVIERCAARVVPARIEIARITLEDVFVGIVRGQSGAESEAALRQHLQGLSGEKA